MHQIKIYKFKLKNIKSNLSYLKFIKLLITGNVKITKIEKKKLL